MPASSVRKSIAATLAGMVVAVSLLTACGLDLLGTTQGRGGLSDKDKDALGFAVSTASESAAQASASLAAFLPLYGAATGDIATLKGLLATATQSVADAKAEVNAAKVQAEAAKAYAEDASRSAGLHGASPAPPATTSASPAPVVTTAGTFSVMTEPASPSGLVGEGISWMMLPNVGQLRSTSGAWLLRAVDDEGRQRGVDMVGLPPAIFASWPGFARAGDRKVFWYIVGPDGVGTGLLTTVIRVNPAPTPPPTPIPTAAPTPDASASASPSPAPTTSATGSATPTPAPSGGFQPLG